MNKTKLFKILLILQLLTAVLCLIIPEFLPDSINQTTQNSQKENESTKYWYLEPIMGLVLILLLISTIGLFWVKRIWYFIFTFSILASLFISPFFNLIAVDGIMGSVYCVTNLITGMILLLGYELVVINRGVD